MFTSRAEWNIVPSDVVVPRMTTGLIVVVAVLLASSAFALWRKRTDGRVQQYEVAPNARSVGGGRSSGPVSGGENGQGADSGPMQNGAIQSDANQGSASQNNSGRNGGSRTGTGRSSGGRNGGGRSGDLEVLRADQLGSELGRQATLVQFSTAFCQPCRAAKVVLASVAATAEGVSHIEIDAESHLDLVREIGIMRTPTTLILDAEGRITARATGVPRKDQVLAAIGRTLPA